MVRPRALLVTLFLSSTLVVSGHARADAQATSLEFGDSGSRVEALEEMLSARGFLRDDDDGVFGTRLAAAVVAFHKEVGAERSNIWSSEDWELLARYQGPWLPSREGEPDRVEINLTRQVMYLVQDEELTAVIPVSSGNGATYQTSSGSLAVAHTPRGDFRLWRHVDGWRVSYLGELYRPWYFRGGYALHGSPSVPTYPASHGCVRVPLWEADYLAGQLALGMPLYVWDEPAGAEPGFLDEPDPALYTGPFVDDEGSIFEEDIADLAEAGITQGCSRFRFCPEQAVTRGQMAAFLTRALHLPRGPDAFSDDDGSLFEADIDALAAAEITAGCGEDAFCPDELVTRGQMAAFLVRGLELPAAGGDAFADDEGHAFEADIDALAAAGITTGCGEDAFCPDELVTREQMAAFLTRALGL